MRKSPYSAVAELDQAFNRADIDSVLSFYDDNASVVLDRNTIIKGKESLRKAFSEIFKLNGSATQEKMSVIESDDCALFISEWVFTWTSEDGSVNNTVNYATTVFKKNSNDEWLIVIDNSIGPAILK